MFDNDNSQYEGLFAAQPDRVEHGIWGQTETHHQSLGPDIRVEKDFWGDVTKIERNWFD